MVVLANNDNVVLAARQAARLAQVPVQVVPSSSLQAGLGSMLAYDSAADAETNAAAMEDTAAGVATGAVTIASRDVSVDGLRIERGAYVGLADGEPVAGGTSFETVATAVVDRLLGEPRDVLTFITGEDEPELGTAPRARRRAASGPRARGPSGRPAPLPASSVSRVAGIKVRGMPAPVRVALAEDNKVFREALELLLGLRNDIQVVGSVEDGAKVVELCRELDPDVIVIDYRLPALDGVQVTKALRKACPDVAVVCLTASANLPEVDALFAAGAVACLAKDEPLDRIVETILSAAGRES